MQTNDEKLWLIARKRASFKRHALVYLAINIFIWIMWFVNDENINRNGIPWPVYTTVGWGLGLFFHGLGAYSSRASLEEREFQKLKDKTN